MVRVSTPARESFARFGALALPTRGVCGDCGGAARLPDPTPEAAERARAGLAAARAAGAHYRRDYLDAPEWDRLARAYGVRLPQWHMAPTPGRMRSWLGRVGVSTTAYLEYAAERTLSGFAAANPQWGLRAWAGLVLEAVAAGVLHSARFAPLPVEDEPAPEEVVASVSVKVKRGRKP